MRHQGRRAPSALLVFTCGLFVACGAEPRATATRVDSPPTHGTTAPDVTPSTTHQTTPTVREAPERGLEGTLVVIDPGHNGGNSRHGAEIGRQVFIGNSWKECDTTGTQTSDGYREHAFTWDLANRLRDLLEEAGATVLLTRADDSSWGPCIDERADVANRAGADLAISLHADGGPPVGRGFHVIVPKALPGRNESIVDESVRFGTVLADVYERFTGMPRASYTGGTKGWMQRDDLGGLNMSNVPKVFLETGNMRNAIDASRLKDASFRQLAASAIAEAVEVYLDD